MKTAEIVSVGTEILMGQIVDTNAQHLGQLFPELGIRHVHRQTVGDNLQRLKEALQLALKRADIVITIGGLGPTQDDLTRDGISAAMDDSMERDPEIEEKLRKLFALRKLNWTDSQVRQCMRPKHSVAIENPNGTAPGLICQKDDKVVIALPGPKNEFKPMVDGPVRDFLMRYSSGQIIHSHLLRICGLGESTVEDRVKELLAYENPSIAPYAKPGEVHLRVTASAGTVEEAEKLMAPTLAKIKELLGDAIFGEDKTTLEEATLKLLEEKDQTVAVAESITGGGLGARMTSVEGASKTFKGGLITYTTKAKENELGVEPKLLNDPTIGPVSAEVAQQMSEGIKRKFESTYGVSLTGNAGPTSDKGDKPVGLTYLAVAGPNGTRVEEYRFRGIREDIRNRAAQFALTLLREEILKDWQN
ncbi:MAG TPA: competence/damage-inducible protein A [Fimbriimonadaceae bacterium]|jgi:nicotinamide-nucleotide amidase